MSLIYQALKQSEQRSSASNSPVARNVVAAPMERAKSRPGMRRPLGLGAMIAGTGVLVGYLLNVGLPAQASQTQVSSNPALPFAQVTGLYDPPESASQDLGQREGSLPRAELPLPTAAPRLRLSPALPIEAKDARDSAAAAPPVAAPATKGRDLAPSLSPVSTEANAPDVIQVKGVQALVVQPSTDDMRSLFEALNTALENRDEALAQIQLQAVQARLPESSVARLRAESWFAHQTGDLDSASRIYRRLLEKIPGDELTSVNLASIEKKRLQPERAMKLLASALRENPSSGALRSAMEQLAQSGVKQ
jgi:tetratricopeptide (TPR) repeat protein